MYVGSVRIHFFTHELLDSNKQVGYAVPKWEPGFLDRVSGSSFDLELPKKRPKNLLEVVEHEQWVMRIVRGINTSVCTSS